MTYQEVLDLLKENLNPRGTDSWVKQGGKEEECYGLSIGQLRKLAKQVKRNHELSLQLWNSVIYDCKVLATLVEEPKKVTRHQVEEQVAQLQGWMLSHVYVSNLLPKTTIQIELALDWKEEKDDMRRRCAFLLLCNLAKANKKLENEWFMPFLNQIEKDILNEKNFVKEAMNNVLFHLGQRNATLHARCLEIAKAIGKIEVDYGMNSCEAVDCVKHLSGARILKKVGAL